MPGFRMNSQSQPPDDQHRRLRQFLNWLQPLALGMSALLLISSLFFFNDDTILAGVALFCYSLFLTWARLQLLRGKIQSTVSIICAGLFVVALVLAWMSPSSVKILVLLPVMATTVALPYVNAPALRRLMYASWVTTIAMMVVTELDNSDPSRALIPDGIETIIGMAMADALILLLLWQFSSRLKATLAQTQAANNALQEAHAKLEQQHAQLIRDVEARKLAEEQRRAIERKLLETQKLERLGVLAGGIAHDFNNLLTSVLGNSELALLQLPPDSPARFSIEQIEVGARRAADLTQQMLAYAGKGRMVIQQIDLNSLIMEMSQLINSSISKNASLRYDLAPNLPPIEGDITPIRQVVMNLIVNASEALDDQGGAISVRTGLRRVEGVGRAADRLADLAEGDYILLQVADTGRGMDAETLTKIFEPFFTTKFAGRGLGLAAVQGIVRSHGGALDVKSAPGRGTTFAILLPAAKRQAAKPGADGYRAEDQAAEGSTRAPAAAPDPAPAARDASAATILVVDDEVDVRKVAELMLSHLGFRVLLARNGQEAIELFRLHRAALACVLLDLTMPHMDGQQVFQALREIDPDVPTILMSGYSEHEVNLRFAGLGLAGFLQKPFSLDKIQGVLRPVLARAHAGE
jgi:signal transduction histidine kinase/CheY-like chemotaxis protein